MSGSAPVILAIVLVGYLLLRFYRAVLAFIATIAVVCLTFGIADVAARLNR
jgi:hypothetical protein